MATISFSRPVTVNSEWGVKNLMKAIDSGSPLSKNSKKDRKRFLESRVASPELKSLLKEKYK